MKINLKNAVAHFYPNPSFEQLYFEAVANAIDAGADEININIKIKAFDAPESLSITIKDNGSGFIDKKFEKFASLLEAENKDHKGLGRLVYLAYFKEIIVESFFDGKKKREFVFNSSFAGKSKVSEYEAQSGTTLKFNDFFGVKINRYDYLKPQCIKESLLEHFFPILFKKQYDNKKLEISIELETDTPKPEYDFFSETVKLTLDDVPQLKKTSFKNTALDFFHNFDIFYSIKNDTSKKKSLLTAICADDRTMQYELASIDSIPAGYQTMFLFNSDFFTGKANSSRQQLDLDNTIPERTLKQILRREIAAIIDEEIPSIVESNSKLSQELANQYPHLAGYFEENNVGLIVKNEAIIEAQNKFFNDQKEVLECDETLSEEQYQKALDLSSRTLAEYILYRAQIIKKLKSMTPNNDEADIHNLLIPQRNIYKKDELIEHIYQNNAWLLDDKYMTYNTILSEESMDKVIKAITLNEEDLEGDLKRPDITLIFSDDPEGNDMVDVVIVELKKQTDDEASNMHAINQLMQRAEKLARYDSKIQRIWYYAIIQVNDTLARRLRQLHWKPLFSLGRVFYQEFDTQGTDGSIIPTPTYVLSYETLINDAECRNRTFLEILKNGFKRSEEESFLDEESKEKK